MLLETPRCLLRDWRDDEVDRLFDIYRHDEVSRWLGRAPKPMADPAEAAALLAGWRQRAEEENPFARWAVEERATGIVAGTVLLNPLPGGDGEVEVGWHLHPDAWGRGLATEAARAVIAYGFSLGLPEIYAVVRPDNVRSRAVCGRLGMTPLGRTSRWYDTELEAFRLVRQP